MLRIFAASAAVTGLAIFGSFQVANAATAPAARTCPAPDIATSSPASHGTVPAGYTVTLADGDSFACVAGVVRIH